MLYFLIYKITNVINGKIYVGKHVTNNLNDDYLGSGNCIKKAVRKYGKHNFVKQILFQFDNEQDMNAKEAEIVNEDFVSRSDTYNLALGGKGGDFVAANKRYKELMADAVFKEKHRQKVKQALNNPSTKQKISKGLKKYYLTHEPSFAGKHHTQETKQKISEAHKKLNNKGKCSPNYGKIWVVHPQKLIECKIDPQELDEYIEKGFRKGRIYKNGNLRICSKLKDGPKMSIQQRTQIQMDKETQRTKLLGKKHCFINKQTGVRKFFRDCELSSIDPTIWQSTWLKYNVEEIKQMKKKKMTWYQIAEYYNTTYNDIYSWYRENKDKFKQ